MAIKQTKITEEELKELENFQQTILIYLKLKKI